MEGGEDQFAARTHTELQIPVPKKNIFIPTARSRGPISSCVILINSTWETEASSCQLEAEEYSRSKIRQHKAGRLSLSASVNRNKKEEPFCHVVQWKVFRHRSKLDCSSYPGSASNLSFLLVKWTCHVCFALCNLWKNDTADRRSSRRCAYVHVILTITQCRGCEPRPVSADEDMEKSRSCSRTTEKAHRGLRRMHAAS